MHYLLTYHYSADYLQRRGEFRNGHLAGAWAAHGKASSSTASPGRWSACRTKGSHAIAIFKEAISA